MRSLSREFLQAGLDPGAPSGLLLIASLLAFLAIPIPAQAAELCASSNEEPAELSEEVSCLRDEVEALKASKDLAQRALLLVVQDLAELRTELRGPPRIVEQIPASKYAIISYLIPRLNSPTMCSPDPLPRDGFTIVGAEVTGPLTLRVDPPDCPLKQPCTGLVNNFGAACNFSSRNFGCYVNTVWLSWHQSRPGASIRVEDICR